MCEHSLIAFTPKMFTLSITPLLQYHKGALEVLENIEFVNVKLETCHKGYLKANKHLSTLIL